MSFIRRVKVGKNTYLVEVEGYRENGKVKQRYIRSIGKEVDGKTVLSGSINRAEITKVSIYGPLLVLNELSQQINLQRSLGAYGDCILALVYAHCLQPKSLNKLQQWFGKTDLNHILNLEDITEKTLLQALDSLEEQNSQSLQLHLFEKIRREFHIENEGLFYDVTNTYFYGVNCPLAKRGHNKDGKNKPQIQIGLVVTKNGGIPLFHKVFDGNIHDARTLGDVFTTLRGAGIKDTTLVWDRGVSSKNNLQEALELGFHVICGLAINPELKREVDKVLAGMGLSSIKNRIKLENSAFYVVRKNYSYGGVKGHIYICLNRKIHDGTQERRYDHMHEAQKMLAENKPLPEGIRKYFNKDDTINEKRLKEAEKYDGISILFSTKSLSAEEAVKSYFEKDLIEKAFKTLKGIVEIRPVRHWLEDRVKAHVFICYLSYLLLSLLNYKVKPLNINAIQALDELESMYKIHIIDPETKNEFTKTVTLTKQQKTILREVNPELIRCCDKKQGKT